MAIYRTDIKVISRSDGHSAVAASAYMSRSTLVNERDGQRYDFRKCHAHEELVADLGVTLPDPAPERFRDRSVLWNEVEQKERASNAQLARRFIVSLPVELTHEQNVGLAKEIVDIFVQEGMCVDACVHDDAKDDHNPHLHMLAPLRSVDASGLLAKAVNVYSVRDKTGYEYQYTAKELKEHIEAGEELEKVYKYGVDGNYSELSPTQAEMLEVSHAVKRKSKTPVQTSRYLNDWNNQNNCEKWREAIAEKINAALAAANSSARVDPRSLARQEEADLIPRLIPVNESYAVHIIEKKAEAEAEALGIAYEPVTEIRKQNIETRKFNKKLMEVVSMLIQKFKKIRMPDPNPHKAGGRAQRSKTKHGQISSHRRHRHSLAHSR